MSVGLAPPERVPSSPPARGRVARLRRWLAEESRATGLPLGALLVVAVVLHVGVTLRAVNPWHPDEHFQILEFAWARAGLSPLADLPWEFRARIRPTLQPALALVALRGLRAAGLTSPFVWVPVLRLATLALALVGLVRGAAYAAPRFGPEGRRALWLSALLLWFLPLFLSRFTSENWSGLALGAALPLVESGGRRARDDVTAGALLGLSFVLRFQMAFAIGALVLWLLVQGRPGWARAARLCAAAAAVVALGTLCDAWFYHAWVFTPWEYLRVNIFEGKASTFGILPWYWYAVRAPLWMAPPLGLALAGLCVVAVVARPRSPWVWAAVAFVAGHSVIAHKELRFLFPLFYLMPVLLATGVEAVGRPRWWRPVAWLALAQNAILALVLLTPSIHRGKNFDWHFLRFVWSAAESRPGAPLYVLQDQVEPYNVWELEGHVYRHPRVTPLAYAPGQALESLVPPGTPTDEVLVVTRGGDAPPEVGPHRLELAYAAEPGYRTMARAVGLERSAAEAWLERVDQWTDTEWVRRVYQVVDRP